MRYLLILLLCTISAQAQTLSVSAYNMGQLKLLGQDFVACPEARLAKQIDAIFTDPQSPLKSAPDFVLLLQEVWTKKAYSALAANAQKYGFDYMPRQYQEIRDNGTMIISNLKATQTSFIPFSVSTYKKKGIRLANFTLGSGKSFIVASVHTGYSDSRNYTPEQDAHFLEIQKLIEQQRLLEPNLIIGGDFNAGPNLKYTNQTYEPGTVIWENGLLPRMNTAQMNLVSQTSADTWDQNNSMVNNATYVIKAFNGMTYHTFAWEEQNSILDHIFASPNFAAASACRVFDQKVKMNCPGRTDSKGRAHLSDHYGTSVVLDLP